MEAKEWQSRGHFQIFIVDQAERKKFTRDFCRFCLPSDFKVDPMPTLTSKAIFLLS